MGNYYNKVRYSISKKIYPEIYVKQGVNPGSFNVTDKLTISQEVEINFSI